MSLPGLGLEEPEEVHTVESSEHSLSKESEWRFEVGVGKYVQLKLLTGTAEIFGTELVPSSPYVFTGTKAAVYTWHGCSFEVSGDALYSEYTAEETPMSEYVNTHLALETLRDHARVTGRDGPRVLILGPEDAGKSTLAKILTGYAGRSGRSPALVNLDVGEGVMSVPGTLTATVFKTLMDVEEGWGMAPMSGPSGTIPVKLPLVYFHGSDRPDEKDGRMYKAQVRRVALAVAGRLAQDPETRSSGIIIDTPGRLTGTKSPVGYEIIQDLVSEFAVSAIVCLGSERLYSDMVKKFDGQLTSIRAQSNPPETISVIKLSKSGGCVGRDDAFMQAFRASQVRAYFFGNPKLSAGISLQPRQQQVDFSMLTVWRRIGPATDGGRGSGGAGGAGMYDDNDDEFLPGGIEEDPVSSSSSFRVALPDSQLYERLTVPMSTMKNSVLAVLNCEPEADQEAIRDASVMGFLFVTDVDEHRGRISVLGPVAGRVPERAIVWAGWPVAAQGMDKA